MLNVTDQFHRDYELQTETRDSDFCMTFSANFRQLKRPSSLKQPQALAVDLKSWLNIRRAKKSSISLISFNLPLTTEIWQQFQWS